MEVKSRLAVSIRWMVRSDAKRVYQIERDSFAEPWDEDQFRDMLSRNNIIGKVAEYREQVIGYIVYANERGYRHLLNMAVDSPFRRQGVGSSLLEHLKRQADQKRLAIIDDVRESNLPMQMLLKSAGFMANAEIEYDAFDNGEAAYRFVWERAM